MKALGESIYMQRALDLALLGAGTVSPNPMVGCVIVHKDRIIGEGYHQNYGEGHAEVHAIESVNDKSLLKESTLYVTLEPCSHFGKTPPCASLIIKCDIPNVYIALEDPNPLVAGRGINMLKQAGVNVRTGLLAKKAAWLNRRFLNGINTQRPYIILKWAETADGFIARENFDSKWISNKISRALVHKWRSEEDAIMVGSNTAMHDNPKLNVRDWTGKDPLRIVIDRNLKLPKDLYLFDGSVPTLLFYNENASVEYDYQKQFGVLLNNKGFLNNLLDSLFEKNIRSILVEGGAALHKAFIEADLWDEARLFKSESVFVNGINAPILNGRLIDSQKLRDDQLNFYVNSKADQLKNGYVS